MKTPDTKTTKEGWLLFFYSVPSRPTSNRLKVWRRLMKAGAVQLKGAVYVLPDNDEHYELFQWLVSEVASMKGDAAFVRVDEIETITDAEVAALFDRRREESYRAVEKKLDEVHRKATAVRNASGTLKDKSVLEGLERCSREFEEIRRTDFFSSEAGRGLGKRIKAVARELAELAGAVEKEAEVVQRRVEDFRGKVWLTRKKPFVDRMASAWLVRRFVDEGASFRFVDDPAVEGTGEGVVSFDVRGGDFTHVGDLCTFEVMVKSFGLKDRALRDLAEVVHELDIKDDRYRNPASKGVEEILSGIRKTAADDSDALEKGMRVFEMYYVSRK